MRIVGHLDMDAFFASIEERDKPRLRGRPVVVGADPAGGRGRGVVSTANYAARAYGIRSAMPISKAWQLSEEARRKGLTEAAFLEVDMEKYADVSGRVMEILRVSLAKGGSKEDTMPVLEQASVDEAYFDLTSAGSYEKAESLARKIKDEIKQEENLTASIGIGPNKLIAKIASDAQKPDGLTVVREEGAEAFLEPLSVRAIPGVGPKAEERFRKMNIRTVRDAKRLSEAALAEMMGKWGAALYEKLRGRDGAPLAAEREAKSVGRNETFGKDAPVTDRRADRKLLESTLAALAEQTFERFKQEGFSSFRAVAIMVRFADFTAKTRVVTLPTPVRADDPAALRTLQFQALRLFMPFLDRRENPERKAIRLLSVRVERLA